MFGRITFTATSSPAGVVAACTCASEAEARGSRSNVANRLSMPPPKLASMRATATSDGNGGT